MILETIEKMKTLSERSILELTSAHEAGAKVIGHYCLYSPSELAIAAGAISVPLCGTRNDPIPAAEEILPRNLCPLIKSSFGFAVTDTCPYFAISDFLVGDTTCDGKKKMFELLSEYKPMHVLQLPQNQDPETALPFWKNELYRLKERLETELDTVITQENLQKAIKLLNRERRVLKRLMDLSKNQPSPISGMDLLQIKFKLGFFPEKEDGLSLVEDIIKEIEDMVSEGVEGCSTSAPRILLTGVPVGLGSEKVVKLIEDCGGVVVCFESCGGYKKVYQVDEDADPMDALAKQYLSTPCSVMSPNTGRYDLLSQLIGDFHVDGVVDLTWQACHTYNVESYSIKKHVKEVHGLPFIQIETDYSDSDTEQLKVRVEAFLEMLG
ncbi:double-cubane-cluster-containing anaerobic reductase [Maridesulfovibrio frigidus]|uniref:double-cubane-cluster-containing anaerobic reductase n=1 Tax=Maridesulfovibrio frigidus TaxID=340956 RepID=UPI0004E16D05|nr:double-cubane-cluster-containing anaerobic reductase [Maridesulfovibrio frigidus]